MDGTYDIGEPDVDSIIIQLKKGRSVVMTIHDEDGVASFGLAGAVSLRDWLNRAIGIMSASAGDPGIPVYASRDATDDVLGKDGE